MHSTANVDFLTTAIDQTEAHPEARTLALEILSLDGFSPIVTYHRLFYNSIDETGFFADIVRKIERALEGPTGDDPMVVRCRRFHSLAKEIKRRYPTVRHSIGKGRIGGFQDTLTLEERDEFHVELIIDAGWIVDAIDGERLFYWTGHCIDNAEASEECVDWMDTQGYFDCIN